MAPRTARQPRLLAAQRPRRRRARSVTHRGPEPIFERAWDAFTRTEHDLVDDVSHLSHPGRYHEPQTTATPAPAATEALVTSVLSEIHGAVTDGVTNIEGWAEGLKEKLPQLAVLAAKYENSPIVAELEKLGDLVLPPEVEGSIVGLIQMGGKLVSGAASAVATPPAAEVPAAPAGPA